MRDLINHDDETTCPSCQGVGRVRKNGILIEQGRRIYELSIEEYKALWFECYEEMELHKLNTSIEEYKRLTTKPIGGSNV